MAYVLDPSLTDEENRKREEQQRAVGGAPGGDVAGGVVPPMGGQPTGTSGSSGSFTNLQRYLTENGPQSADLAQKVAGTVTAVGDEAKGAAQGVIDAGKQQIEAARVQPTGIIDEAATNPTGVAGDAAKKAEFLKQRDASYTGPAGIETLPGYSDAQAKVKAAEEKINLTGSEAGRTTLLKDMGGPGYGQGKASLNQLLLSGSPEAAGIVSKAAEPYKNLTSYLSAGTDDARAAALAASKEADATRAAVANRFTGENGVIPSFSADIAKRVTDAQGGMTTRNAQIQADLKSLNLSAQDLTDLGLTPEQFGKIMDDQRAVQGQSFIDPLAFSSTRNPAAEIDAGNVATGEDYAREAALADLLGVDISTLNPADAARAGTAPKSGVSFDTPGATGAAHQKFMEAKVLPSVPMVDQYQQVAFTLRDMKAEAAARGQDFSGIDQAQHIMALNGGKSYMSFGQLEGLPAPVKDAIKKAYTRAYPQLGGIAYFGGAGYTPPGTPSMPVGGDVRH